MMGRKQEWEDDRQLKFRQEMEESSPRLGGKEPSMFEDQKKDGHLMCLKKDWEKEVHNE